MDGRAGSAGAGLLRILRILRRRAVTVGLVTAAALAVAATLAARRTETRVAEARVLLLAPDDQLSASTPDTTSEREVQNQVEVVLGDGVGEEVRRALGDAPAVTVVPIAGTDVLAIRATDPDPGRAARVAGAYARAFLDVRRRQATEDLERSEAALRARLAELRSEADAAAPPGPDTVAAPTPDGPDRRQRLLDRHRALGEALDRLSARRRAQDGDGRLLSTVTTPVTPPGPLLDLGAAGVLGVATGTGLALVAESLDTARRAERDGEGPG